MFVQARHDLDEIAGQVAIVELRRENAVPGILAGARRAWQHEDEGGVGDARDRPLYVGTSRNLRARVRQYFQASETRSRMGEMIGLAERVDPIECAHPLEAQVRELRLIAAHKPRYNRRSKYPERSVWLKLTAEAYPRLSIVRVVRDDGCAAIVPV